MVQKSLAEGFGLTVAEAMWKARPVVASAVGGIVDQIEHERSGLLLPDPRDGVAFGAAVVRLLDDEQEARRLGLGGRERVREHFLSDRSLIDYLKSMAPLVGALGPYGGTACSLLGQRSSSGRVWHGFPSRQREVAFAQLDLFAGGRSGTWRRGS